MITAPRYVRVPSTDGRFQLRVRVYTPEDSVNNGAAIVGPVYSNTVRNVWGRWSVFQMLLVQRGYTVLQVDVRGSTGNGRKHTSNRPCDVYNSALDRPLLTDCL